MIRDKVNEKYWPLRKERFIVYYHLVGVVERKIGSVLKKYHLVLAGLATPLVFSVHSIVSFDFATSVIPGWHTTIFPPYFVAGAVFSGFAMVQTLLLVMRKVVGLEAYITIKHVEYMNIVIMLTGNLVGIAYLTELVYGMVLRC